MYFEDVSSQRLREFRTLMQEIDTAWEAIIKLRHHISKFKSNRLKKLISFESNEKTNI